MAEIFHSLEHPFWGTLRKREGADNWEHEIVAHWPGRGDIRVCFYVTNPEDEIAQRNYETITQQWESLWPRILSRTDAMRAYYGYGEFPTDLSRDYFDIRLATSPLDEGAEWTVMLQAKEAGWLLDFKGWDDFGGQGVF